MREADSEFPLDLGSYAGLEAQVAAIADDIAYDNHDLDDGLRARFFTLQAALEVPFVAETWDMVRERFADAPHKDRLTAELVRHMIGRMVSDLLAETRARIQALAPRTVEDVRAAGRTLVAFSPAMATAEKELKQFLRAEMYNHPRNLAIREPARQVVAGLFDHFHTAPNTMPDGWGASAPLDEPARARHVADFIAGMTDRYAVRTHVRYVGPVTFPDDNLI
jgi:dGTPase